MGVYALILKILSSILTGRLPNTYPGKRLSVRVNTLTLTYRVRF